MLFKRTRNNETFPYPSNYIIEVAPAALWDGIIYASLAMPVKHMEEQSFVSFNHFLPAAKHMSKILNKHI